jgi:hypothetical protein
MKLPVAMIVVGAMTVSCAARRPITASSQAAFTPALVTVVIGGALPGERLEAAYVAPEFFASTAGRMTAGRPIVSYDCRKGSAGAAVVLSHDFWRDRLGSATSMIGSRIQIDGKAATVIGIGPPGFRPQGAGWLWLPRVER